MDSDHAAAFEPIGEDSDVQTEHVVWADSADETVRMLSALHEQQAQDEDADLDDREELDALVDY